MGKSEDLMKGIDRVGIFERMKDYEDMAFETRAIDVGNDSGRSAMPIYASVTGDTYQRHGDPSRDAISTCIASLEGMNYCLVTGSRCISNDTADAGFIEKG